LVSFPTSKYFTWFNLCPIHNNLTMKVYVAEGFDETETHIIFLGILCPCRESLLTYVMYAKLWQLISFAQVVCSYICLISECRLLVLSIFLTCASVLSWSFVPRFLKLMIQLSSQVRFYEIHKSLFCRILHLKQFSAVMQLCHYSLAHILFYFVM